MLSSSDDSIKSCLEHVLEIKLGVGGVTETDAFTFHDLPSVCCLNFSPSSLWHFPPIVTVSGVLGDIFDVLDKELDVKLIDVSPLFTGSSS